MPAYASFSAWSQAKKSHKIYLLTVTGKRYTGAAVETITRRYATEPYATLPTDSPANTEFLPLLRNCPDIQQALAWVNGSDLSGTPRSFAAFAHAVLANNGDALGNDWGPGRHNAEGWDVVLDVTGPHTELAYANRGHLLTGVGGKHTLSDTEMTLELFDNAAKWDVTLGADELLVSNYANLPVGNIGKTKPVVLGQVFNHEPVLIDDASFVYLVSNENVQAISAVYSNLHALTLSSEYTVQLTASGGATFTLASSPGDARITCDVQGRKPAHLSAYSANKGEVIESIIREDAGAGTSDFNTSALAAFKTATHDIGYVVTAPMRALALVDLLLATPRDYYEIEGDGKFALHTFTAPSGSPDFTFTTANGKIVELIGSPIVEEITPIYEAIVSYEHVEVTMAESETAGAADLEAKHRVKEEYRTRRSTDAVVQTWAKRATSLGPLLSRLVNSADAATIAASLMSLFGVGRWLVRGEFKLQPFNINLGDVIELDRTKLGLDVGDPNLFRVVARQVTRRGVELTLFQ